MSLISTHQRLYANSFNSSQKLRLHLFFLFILLFSFIHPPIIMQGGNA
jgi:hypothetical protein